VVEKDGCLHGVEGVIDKDLATSLLARRIEADLMIITTDVEKVAVKYNTPQEQPLDRLSVGQAKKLMDYGEFPPGSMGPKIQAAIEFVEETGNDVIITLPEKMIEAMAGKTGTWIVI
jgi:carbamate kinase